MFCSACGSEISLAAEVCPSCGRQVAQPTSRALTPVGHASASSGFSATAPGASGASWAHPVEPVGVSAMEPVAVAAPMASIFAGDLDAPSFPRDLPGRAALLTGLVMAADLLLPWVSVNGDGYAPTRFGLPALALLALLIAVIAPPLLPRWRNAPITHMAPFGVGALLLGFSGALWALSGPLAPALTRALLARVFSAGGPFEVNTTTGASLSMSPIQVAPALGLYIFVLGALALTVAGYLKLAHRGER